MKHSVSFMSVIVPQFGHSRVFAPGGPDGAGGGGGARAVGARAGAAGRAGARAGGAGGAGSSFLRRFANTRKYRSAATTAMMIPRRPPITTRSMPPADALIVKAGLCTVKDSPSPSITVRTIFTSAASMFGATQEYERAPVC